MFYIQYRPQFSYHETQMTYHNYYELYTDTEYLGYL